MHTYVKTANHTHAHTHKNAQMFLIKHPKDYSIHLICHTACVTAVKASPTRVLFTFHSPPCAGDCACRWEREALRPQGNFNSILLLLSGLETTHHLPDASRPTWRLWAALRCLHPGSFTAPARCTVCAGSLLCLTSQSHAIMCVSWITICTLLSLTQIPTHRDTWVQMHGQPLEQESHQTPLCHRPMLYILP